MRGMGKPFKTESAFGDRQKLSFSSSHSGLNPLQGTGEGVAKYRARGEVTGVRMLRPQALRRHRRKELESMA